MKEPGYPAPIHFNKVLFLFEIFQKQKYHLCETDFSYISRLRANDILICYLYIFSISRIRRLQLSSNLDIINEKAM